MISFSDIKIVVAVLIREPFFYLAISIVSLNTIISNKYISIITIFISISFSYSYKMYLRCNSKNRSGIASNVSVIVISSVVYFYMIMSYRSIAVQLLVAMSLLMPVILVMPDLRAKNNK